MTENRESLQKQKNQATADSAHQPAQTKPSQSTGAASQSSQSRSLAVLGTIWVNDVHTFFQVMLLMAFRRED